MMSNLQYLLTKLAEEGTEVGQMALKNQHFGIDECQFSGGESNRERLYGEINDLLGVIRLLNEEEAFGFEPDEGAIIAKMNKIRHYRDYSVSLGLVKKKWTKAELIQEAQFSITSANWPLGAVVVHLNEGGSTFRTKECAEDMIKSGFAHCYATYDEIFGGENAQV